MDDREFLERLIDAKTRATTYINDAKAKELAEITELANYYRGLIIELYYRALISEHNEFVIDVYRVADENTPTVRYKLRAMSTIVEYRTNQIKDSKGDELIQLRVFTQQITNLIAKMSINAQNK